MDIELPKDKSAFLLKFIKPEYEDSFVEGKLYMNTLKYFIDLEKESGIRGVGDAYEASAVYSDLKASLINPDTREVLVDGKIAKLNFHSIERVNTPVFCMFAVDKDVLKVVSADKDYVYTIAHLEKSELEQLIKDFGNNMYVLDAFEFASRVKRKCEDLNILCKMNKVEYHDFSKNYESRIRKYQDLESVNVCFIKDDFFKCQNEYRILLDNVYSETPYVLDIGDISDIATKFKITDFFNGELRIALNRRNLDI